MLAPLAGFSYSSPDERTFGEEYEDGQHPYAGPGEAPHLLEAEPRVPLDGEAVRSRGPQLHGLRIRPGYAAQGRGQCVEGRIAPTKRFFARPLLGKVQAGLSQPVPDDDYEVLTIDDYLVPEPSRTFLARVKGDSLRDAALVDGDMVVVQKNCPTKVGDIVVAVIDGQVTVKYLRQQPDGRFYLQPANAAFADILPEGELENLGVVVGAFRAYRR